LNSGERQKPTLHRWTALGQPNDEKRARIVRQIVGPVERLQLRHVPSDWLIYSMNVGPNLAASIERLRRAAKRRAYVVEEEVTHEDWNPKIRGMMQS
jgi:hypothetical protein